MAGAEFFRPSGKLRKLGITQSTPRGRRRARTALRPFGDIDRDGVKNFMDCKPFNPRKQGPFHDLRERIAEERLNRQQRRAGSDGRVSDEEVREMNVQRQRVSTLREQGERIRERETRRREDELARARARKEIQLGRAEVATARAKAVRTGGSVARIRRELFGAEAPAFEKPRVKAKKKRKKSKRKKKKG